MCTTLQYVRRCRHPATHRFRDNLCKHPNGPTCRITDREVLLPIVCNRCLAKKKARSQSARVEVQSNLAAFESQFTDIWYVPSRCFIDVGFSTLDPFGGTAGSRAGSEDTTVSDASSGSASDQELMSIGAAKKLAEQLAPEEKQISDCCERERQNGCFVTTRLESWDARVYGRIWDNRCGAES